jgi:hypothetical protein
MDVPKLYRKRFSTIEYEQKNQLWRILCEHFFQKYVHPSDAVLDVGAGYCEFINHINCRHKIALDSNEETKLYADKAVQVIQASGSNMSMLPDAAVHSFHQQLPRAFTE